MSGVRTMVVMIPVCKANNPAGVIDVHLRRAEQRSRYPGLPRVQRVLGGFVAEGQIYYVCVVPWRPRWTMALWEWLPHIDAQWLRVLVPGHTGLVHHWVAADNVTVPSEQPIPEFWNTPDYIRGVHSWYATTKKERERGHQILP